MRSIAHPYPHPLRQWVLLLSCMVAVLVASFAFSAHAQIYGSVNSGLGCGGGGNNLLNAGSCPSDIKEGKIFSYFVCNTEKLIGEVFGEFYCQLNQKFKAPMSAVITLAIVLFGVAFLIGVVQATAREFMIFLFKVAAVWGFATQADLLIGVAYQFFMGGLKEGIALVVKGVFNPGGGFAVSGDGGQQIYAFMDDVFKKAVKAVTQSAGADQGADEFCKNSIFAVLVLLAIAFPPLFGLAVFLLVKFVLFFLRAVFGYIYAVLGISFLIVLAPIFLSFIFWKQTREYFDKWVGHLAAFALQMVIVFAFIAFVLSMDASQIGKDLMKLVVPNKKSAESVGTKSPLQLCTICEFEIVDSSGAATGGGSVPPGGSARCKDDPGKPIDPSALMGPEKKGERETLLKLAATQIVTLLVLVYIINALLDVIPNIAQMLASAGGVVAPNLTGAAQNPVPFEQAINTAVGQFEAHLGQGGNPITAYSDAFKAAASSLMVGARDAHGNVRAQGMSQLLQEFILDPLPGAAAR